jgi:hypothetical protein
MMMERVGDRWGKMEGSCSTGQSPQRAVVPVEEEEEERRKRRRRRRRRRRSNLQVTFRLCITSAES